MAKELSRRKRYQQTKRTPSSHFLMAGFPEFARVKEPNWSIGSGYLPFKAEVGALVYYFPEGHRENLCLPRSDKEDSIPRAILCKIESIKYLADPIHDGLLAKIRLKSVPSIPAQFDKFEGVQQPSRVFSRSLVASDLTEKRLYLPNNDSVKVFPLHNGGESVATVTVSDLSGREWVVKHRRAKTRNCYYLTGGGWMDIVLKKKLAEGDQIIFMKTAEERITFSVVRTENKTARNFILSDEISKDFEKALKKAVKKAVKKRSFRITFFPNWINFIVDPAFYWESLSRLTLTDGKVKVKVKKCTSNAEGVLSLSQTAAMSDEGPSWKKLEVLWDGEGYSVKINAWDVQLSKRI